MFNEVFWPIAAKEHRCAWCGESILKAEKHAHFVGIWEGELQDWRMHKECYASANLNDELRDGFMYYEHDRPAKIEVTHVD